MKTSTLLTALSLAGLCAMPLSAQDTPAGEAAKPAAAPSSGSLVDKAAELAADKNADIGDICEALYKAVQADPDNAHNTLARVLGGRESWTANQVHSLLTATLMGCPELVSLAGNVQVVEAGTDDAAEAEQAAADYQSQTGGTKEVSPMLKNIVDVLYQSPAVSEAVVESVVTSIAAAAPSQLTQINQNVNAGDTSSGSGQNTNATPNIVPGPEDVSGTH